MDILAVVNFVIANLAIVHLAIVNFAIENLVIVNLTIVILSTEKEILRAFCMNCRMLFLYCIQKSMR